MSPKSGGPPVLALDLVKAFAPVAHERHQSMLVLGEYCVIKSLTAIASSLYHCQQIAQSYICAVLIDLYTRVHRHIDFS